MYHYASLSIYLSIYLSISLSINQSINLSISLSLSLPLSIHLSMYLSIYLCIYLSIYRSINQPIDFSSTFCSEHSTFFAQSTAHSLPYAAMPKTTIVSTGPGASQAAAAKHSRGTEGQMDLPPALTFVQQSYSPAQPAAQTGTTAGPASPAPKSADAPPLKLGPSNTQMAMDRSQSPVEDIAQEAPIGPVQSNQWNFGLFWI